MNKKSIIRMIVDILMILLMLLEYSKLYTGQLLHEIFGTLLLVLFIVHNTLNINFYKNIFKGKYNAQRIVITTIDLTFLLCMIFTIILGIPISEKIFKFLGLNGNMTIRKLHTIFGYWGMIILGVHLGLHFKMMFVKLNKKIENNKLLKISLYITQILIIIYGIKAMRDTKLGLYLIGDASFAIPTNIFLSLFNNLAIIFAIALCAHNIQKILTKRKNLTK